MEGGLGAHGLELGGVVRQRLQRGGGLRGLARGQLRHGAPHPGAGSKGIALQGGGGLLVEPSGIGGLAGLVCLVGEPQLRDPREGMSRVGGGERLQLVGGVCGRVGLPHPRLLLPLQVIPAALGHDREGDADAEPGDDVAVARPEGANPILEGDHGGCGRGNQVAIVTGRRVRGGGGGRGHRREGTD